MADLVFIYGPPAVGKLTVATEVSRLSGYRLFHNHLSLDSIENVFEWGSPPFWESVEAHRIAVVAAGLSHGLSLVLTYAYARPDDDPFIRRLRDQVTRSGGRFCPVRLHCGEATLYQRVIATSRQSTQKARTTTKLREILSQHDCHGEIPDATSLSIDTDAHEPDASARLLMQAYAIVQVA